jgi:hypothetical protein
LATSAVASVDRSRSGVTTSRVLLEPRPGTDAEPLVVDGGHDDIAVLYQLALELAGLPFPARKRLLDDAVIAPAAKIDRAGAGAAPTPGEAPAQVVEPRPTALAAVPPDHDLLGCLARLLAAGVLTVEEFEAKRERLEG